ncbi:Cell wall integrity/stress response component [Hirschfeldia incana]|nr:Cell wall integrity/stress response component [Hirschfeldia incana]
MASLHSLAAVSIIHTADLKGTSIAASSCSSSTLLHPLSSLRFKPRELSIFPNHHRRVALKGRAIKAQSSKEANLPPAGDAFSSIKHLLLPVIDRNPYLSEGTRQAAATTTSLANKYGAEITVVVIDEEKRESSSEHETQVSNIRWHLAEGGFEEFKLLERLGEGKKATAVIGEVADELGTEMVVMSMEAIHSKFIDANLLAEFIPCPVLLLPL